MFEIVERDGLARIGKLKTKHGTITTPSLLPVINPHILTLKPEEIRRLGADAIITNSYIIYKDEELREKALEKGIHSIISFNGPIMTDSGSFQMYVYGDVDVDAVEIVKFQRDIGSDIGTILDIFSYTDDSEIAKKELEETIRRARESAGHKGDMLLAATVQGGIDEKLRERAGRMMSRFADVVPIGGVVPLMENQRYRELAKVIIASKKGIEPSKPVHLFGAGHPMVFPMATLLGCDMFDSSSYIKYARDDRIILPDGTLKLQELKEIPCSCEICSKYSVKELMEMEKEERVKKIAYHNLAQAFAEIKRVREAIRNGSLWELVERRATSHPFLMEALEGIKKHKKWLEKWENISKKRAFMYTGVYSVHRPLIYRFNKRIRERYTPHFEDTIFVEEVNKPYSRNEKLKKIDKNVIISAPFGPVPLELDEIYPVAQSVFPKNVDIATKIYSKRMADNLSFSSSYKWKKNYDIRKIISIADYQFGKNAGKFLFGKGKIKIVKSRKTGKIRNVYVDGKHIVSMRASDGFFTLKIEGAKILHSSFPPPKLRVTVSNEAEPFIRDGKNVFAKFVLDCDYEIRPYDEVLIVNEKDELIGVGQSIMNREEMLSFSRGVAVKTRYGLKNS